MSSNSIDVRLDPDFDGYLVLRIEGVVVGKARPGKDMVLRAGLSKLEGAEAALGLLRIIDGWPEETNISRSIEEFRAALASGGRRSAGESRQIGEASELCEADRDFLRSFFDFAELERFADMIGELARSALSGPFRSEAEMGSAVDRFPRAVSRTGVRFVLTTCAEGDDYVMQLSMSRESRLPPVYARTLSALAAWRIGAPIPSEIVRSQNGVWHVAWEVAGASLHSVIEGLEGCSHRIDRELEGQILGAAQRILSQDVFVAPAGDLRGKPPG